MERESTITLGQQAVMSLIRSNNSLGFMARIYTPAGKVCAQLVTMGLAKERLKIIPGHIWIDLTETGQRVLDKVSS